MILLVLLALVGAACSDPFQVSSGSSPITRTFTVGVPASLMVNNEVGTIHVHPGSGMAVVVQATKHSGLGGADPQVTMNQTDSTTVSIKTHCPPRSSIDLDITAPSASQLQLQTGAGDIQIEGINGQVNAETGSGGLTATSITGQANLRTGSGLVNVSQAGLNGNSRLSTGSGDISFDGSLDPKGTYRLETGSGSVDLTLPADSSLSLNLHTDVGSINNGFESNETGRSFTSSDSKGNEG
jgi:hypothetical protein